MLVIPYRVDVPLYRWPIANFVILGALAVCFGLEVWQLASNPVVIAPFILDGWGPRGLVGHIFLHGGFLHLFGNMVFLWVFGNAVCEKVGNIAYPFIFVGLGIAAGAAHVLMSGGPAIGASGAINGVVGMYLVWFPLNEISTFYLFWLFFFVRYGWFDVSSYWMILLWLLFDVWGAFSGAGQVAYWAHLGGFGAGAALALLLTKLQWVDIYDTERTLLDIFHLSKPPPVNPLAKDRPSTTYRTRYEAMSTAHPGPVAPAPRPPAQPLPPQAPIPFELPTMLKFRCQCGQVVRVKREYAGRQARCPACRQTILIPKA